MVRLSIIGCGLIGGSMARALKGRGTGSDRRWHVTVYDVRPERATQAVAAGAADVAAESLAAAVAQADLVVVATPAMAAVTEVLQEASRHAPASAVFTDTGSVKQAVVSVARNGRLEGGQWFIGGHPMAGSERAGWEAADPFLFENAVYVLTPAGAAPPEALERVEALVEALGARPVRMAAEMHDRVVAAVSHLPHLISAALVQSAAELAEQGVPVWQLAATGFRDMTRLAQGSPAVWWPIFFLNRPAVLESLDRFLETAGALREMIAGGDPERLEAWLASAQATRSGVRFLAKGYGRPLWDVVVQVADRPGAIAGVTEVLAQAAINIADIEILRVREGEGGTLRLGFASEEMVDRALGALCQAGYEAWAR